MTHPTGWPTAQSICDIPEVRAALDAFAQDANEENMLAMVSAIMGARVPLTIPAEQPRWSVTVEVAGESILTISDQHCSGKSLAGMDTHCVEKAALNLLGFIGKSPEDMTCPNCNGEGHVHNQVGEYLGECSCVFSLHTRNTIPDADLWKLLPGDGRYLDLPDGGSPSLLTQLQRMAEDARNARITSPASVRAAALEEAAKECDLYAKQCYREANDGDNSGASDWRQQAAEVLAEEIRALSAAPAGGLGDGDSKRDSFGAILAQFMTPTRIEDLKRFDEFTQDGEGYDIDLEDMDALADIGLIRRTSGRHFQFTDLGLMALSHYAAIAAAQGEGK